MWSDAGLLLLADNTGEAGYCSQLVELARKAGVSRRGRDIPEHLCKIVTPMGGAPEELPKSRADRAGN